MKGGRLGLAPKTAPKGVQLWVKRRPSRPWQRTALALAGVVTGIGGAMATLILALWLSAALLLRAQPPAWVLHLWPQTATLWGDALPELETDIQAGIRAQGNQGGEWLDLTTHGTDARLQGLWLLPVWRDRRACTRHCTELVELRLYGRSRTTPQGRYFQLIHALPVQGVAPGLVTAPLAQGGVAVPVVTQSLPLGEIQSLRHPDLPGAWLTAVGQWRQGSFTLRYGHLIQVDPQRLEVRLPLAWTSPPGSLPQWQSLGQQGTTPPGTDPQVSNPQVSNPRTSNPQVATPPGAGNPGSGSKRLPELVINQGVGLEPGFQIYTLEGITLIPRLEPVDLNPVTPVPGDSDAYDAVLYLARHGLWSVAQTRLEALKSPAMADHQWSLAAERQLQLITLHAQVTQSQADRDWSQPSQQVLALLVDGRWEQALTALETDSGAAAAGVKSLLSQDPGNRLWQRVTATLRMEPQRQAARIWGALLMWAKEDWAAAEAWLAESSRGATLDSLKEQLLALDIGWEGPPEEVSEEAVAAANPALGQGWVGTAFPMTAAVTEWQPLPQGAGLTSLAAGQRWYRIDLDYRRVGGQWQRLEPPGAAPTPASLTAWGQALGAAPPLQLWAPEERPGGWQMRGVQWSAQGVSLAAAGTAQGDGPWLAISGGTFVPLTQPVASPLVSYYPPSPEAAATWYATLGQAWSLAETPEETLSWPPGLVRQGDVTGDGQMEQIVTGPGVDTVILTAAGELLYQDRGDRPLMGWISGPGATVLVEWSTASDRYHFRPWLPNGQGFAP